MTTPETTAVAPSADEEGFGRFAAMGTGMGLRL
jgi:hypothetical protein